MTINKNLNPGERNAGRDFSVSVAIETPPVASDAGSEQIVAQSRRGSGDEKKDRGLIPDTDYL
jgi:hypothetical protein